MQDSAELASARVRVTLTHLGADRRRIEVAEGMIVLGFDTATRATAVALRLADGSTLQMRDDPGPGPAARSRHAPAGRWWMGCS